MRRLKAHTHYEITSLYPDSNMYGMEKQLIGAVIMLEGKNFQRTTTNTSIHNAVRHAHVAILSGALRGLKPMLTHFHAKAVSYQDTCYCAAYKFPHRTDGGKCKGGSKEAFCGECKLPCTVLKVDEGIGPYEYWGSKEIDRQPGLASACCDAQVFSNSERTIEFDGS